MQQNFADRLETAICFYSHYYLRMLCMAFFVSPVSSTISSIVYPFAFMALAIVFDLFASDFLVLATSALYFHWLNNSFFNAANAYQLHIQNFIGIV